MPQWDLTAEAARTGVPAAARGPGRHTLGHGRRGETVLALPGTPAPWPLLVFFHGAGGTAEQGLGFLEDMAAARGLALLLPTSEATTWDLLVGGPARDVDHLRQALAQVLGVGQVQQVAFSGFSDGASYALSLGLANGGLVRSVVAFSPGFVAPPVTVGSPRVWVCHGTQDTVLPVDRCGRRVVERLRGRGYDVTYEEFPGAHVVRPELVGKGLDWWLGPRG